MPGRSVVARASRRLPAGSSRRRSVGQAVARPARRGDGVRALREPGIRREREAGDRRDRLDTVPEARLLPARTGGTRRATASTSSSRTRAEERLRGEVWEESVVDGQLQGNDLGGARWPRSRRTFPVDPGEYTAVVTIEVIDTSRRFTEEQAVRVVGGRRGGSRSRRPSSTRAARIPSSAEAAGRRDRRFDVSPPRGGRRAINPGAVYGDFERMGARRLRASSCPAGRGGGFPRSHGQDPRTRGGAVVRYTRRIVRSPARAAIRRSVSTSASTISPSANTRSTPSSETADGAQRSESAGRFVVLFNAGLLGDAYRRSRRSALARRGREGGPRRSPKRPPAERVHAWALFWRKRDPTPSTESNEAFGEFLQRLRYVLASFSKQRARLADGYGQDLYARTGAPTRSRTGRRRGSARNYQLWYYYSKGHRLHLRGRDRNRGIPPSHDRDDVTGVSGMLRAGVMTLASRSPWRRLRLFAPRGRRDGPARASDGADDPRSRLLGRFLVGQDRVPHPFEPRRLRSGRARRSRSRAQLGDPRRGAPSTSFTSAARASPTEGA